MATTPAERIAWRFMAVGFGLVAAGLVTVSAVETIYPGGVPAFGPIDVFFISAYVMLLIGLARLPQLSGNRSRRMRLLLDALIGGVSVGVVLWIYVIRDLVAAQPGTPLSHQVIASTYPIVDLAAIVAVMIVLVRRSEYRFDARLMFFTLGASLQAIADINYLQAAGRAFGEAEPIFPVMLLASAAFLGTATLVHRQPRPREFAERNASIFWMIAPYGAAAGMVGLLMREVMSGSLPDKARLLLSGTLAVGALVILRQIALLRENREVVESQRATLVSSISHELRTPLTAMVGFLSLLNDPDVRPGLTEGEQSEMLSTVYSQSTYLSRIVHDLVMLARDTGDNLAIERRLEDVAELVRTSAASADGGRQELILDATDELEAYVDGGRIRQAIVNLLSNAYRYGGDRVTVVARAQETTLVIEVHDDGPGVPKKYELTMWDRFERGPNRLNATVPGSGIGLAIVDIIARSHGGSASYRQSELLGGACFSMEIPDAVQSVESPAG